MNTTATATTIKRSTIFTTRDGQQFDSMAEAQLHEASLDLLAIFIKKGFVNDGGVKAVCRALATHYGEFSDALTKLKVRAGQVNKAKK